MFVYQCWVADAQGNPKKIKHQVPSEPITWPTRRTGLVEALGPVPEDIVIRAESLGWKYNPATKTFCRED